MVEAGDLCPRTDPISNRFEPFWASNDAHEWRRSCHRKRRRLVSFMQYDLGFFDQETGWITSAENPFGAKVLPMCPE